MPELIENQKDNVDEEVERLGWGWAQIRILWLAHGTWLVEAQQVVSNQVFSVYLSSQLGWSNQERASLASCTFIGIVVGCFLGGYTADRFGRKPPILAAYMLDIAVPIIQICAGPRYAIVLALRLCMGFGHGLGMPSSLALASETCPSEWRSFLTGLRAVLFALGAVAMNLTIACDDPTFHQLHWRALVGLTVPLPLIFLPLAIWLMPESPKLLAKLGRWDDAYQNLDILRRLNHRGAPLGNLPSEATLIAADKRGHYNSTEETESRVHAMSLQQRLQIIFGKHIWLTTAVLMLGAVTFNGLIYGHGYAFPLIIKKIADEGGSGLKPAWQNVMHSTTSIPLNGLVAAGTAFFPNRSFFLMGCVLGIISMLLLIATMGIPEKEGIVVVLYYIGVNLPTVAECAGFTAIYQLSVDLYPVNAAATSSGVVVTAGRLSAIVWPLLFEAVGGLQQWHRYYYVLITMCAVTFPSVWCAIPAISPLPTSKEIDDENEKVPLASKAKV